MVIGYTCTGADEAAYIDAVAVTRSMGDMQVGHFRLKTSNAWPTLVVLCLFHVTVRRLISVDVHSTAMTAPSYDDDGLPICFNIFGWRRIFSRQQQAICSCCIRVVAAGRD